MEWNVFSFFINNEEGFINLNPNILETEFSKIVSIYIDLFKEFKNTMKSYL